MSNLPAKLDGHGSQAFCHAPCAVEAAHYMRQATLILRQRSARINHVWCKNLRSPDGLKLWKH